MNITIQNARLAADLITLGDHITFESITLEGATLCIETEPSPHIRIQEAKATLVVTEANLNRLLVQQNERMEGIRDLQIATLSGKVRLSGRRKGVPFLYTAVPEIEGGARIRFNPHQLKAVGVSLPRLLMEPIAETINKNMAEHFDITKMPLPFPLRLTALTVEPGRLILSAAARVELRPLPAGESAPKLPEPENVLER